LIAKHVRMVDALRDSTQHTWAMNELAVERGALATVPEYPRMIDATLLLLATGMLGDADAETARRHALVMLKQGERKS